jgi:hypothetical protein
MRALTLVVAAGCGAFGGSDRPGEGNRLVSGRLTPPDAGTFARQPLALELVAASLDTRAEEPLLRFIPGIPFSPSANGGQPVTFRLAIPADETFVLFFQAPVEGTGGIGHLIAPLRFARDASGTLTDLSSGRVEGGNAPLLDVDLGVVEIGVASDTVGCESETCSRTYQVVLGEGASKNPLGVIDTDGDGTPDLDDADDDGDLIPDEADDDANGDGVPDQFQTLDALADFDDDGVPDRFQSI